MTANLTGEAHRPGRIEVVCGSMFSGKTEELIRRMRRAKFAKQRVEIFKPAIDVRYSEEDVVSHDQNHILSTPIDSSASILLLASDIDVVRHSSRSRHGLQRHTFRSDAWPLCHCRRSNESACHLCEVWQPCICEPQKDTRRASRASWRDFRIRTSLSRMLSEGHSRGQCKKVALKFGLFKKKHYLCTRFSDKALRLIR